MVEQSDTSRNVLKRATRIVPCVMLVLALALMPSLRSMTDGDADASSESPYLPLYFEMNGQITNGPFLGYWLSNQHIGEPVSHLVSFNGHWTQWFEYARLELHYVPFDIAVGADITEMPIGTDFSERIGYATQFDAFTPKPSGPERFFPDTGHSLTGGFQLAYEQPGASEQLGPPISDEFSIGETVYQFFEYGGFSWISGGGVERVAVDSLDASFNGQLADWQPMPAEAIDLTVAQSLADTSWEDSIDREESFSILAGMNDTVASFEYAGDFDQMYLADSLPGERWLEVDLSDYSTTAWVGDVPVLRSTSVIGPEQSPTPIGDHYIWLMYESQTMSGIDWDGTPYYQEDVPWVAYFYQDFAFHGTTWRTEFGFADGQGCVVNPNLAAEAIWNFTEYGMYVSVHE